MLKHWVVPLGGFDFDFVRPLSQNEKVQYLNCLITADISRSQNLSFFFQKRLNFANSKCFAICQGKISLHLFKTSQTQTDSKHICTDC